MPVVDKCTVEYAYHPYAAGVALAGQSLFLARSAERCAGWLFYRHAPGTPLTADELLKTGGHDGKSPTRPQFERAASDINQLIGTAEHDLEALKVAPLGCESPILAVVLGAPVPAMTGLFAVPPY
jgi:hypothetical protein